MSVDLTRLTAHLSPQQQEDVKKAYHRRAEHSTAAFLYCFFLGIFGAHRFYLRQWGKGFLHLIFPLAIVAAIVAGIEVPLKLTIIALIVIPLLLIALIWEIVDLFTIDDEVNARNLKLAEQLIATSLLADTTVDRQAQAKLDSTVRTALTQAESTSHQEQAVTDQAAASALPPASGVAEVAAMSTGTPIAEEIATRDVRGEESAAISSGTYAATTVTEISANPDEPKQRDAAQTPEPHSWSTTESAHVDQSDSMGAGAGDVAAITDGVAAAEGFSLDQSLTMAHTETDHSVTDSVEMFRTLSASETVEEQDAIVAEAAPNPVPVETPSASYAAPFQFDQPETVAVSDDLNLLAVAADGAGIGAVAAAGDALLVQSEPPARDVTDMAEVATGIKPVADVATAGATPLHVILPDESRSAVETAPAFLAPDEAAADAFVVLLPDEDSSAPAETFTASDPGIAALSFGQDVPSEASLEVPAEAYIPPTVPVVTVASFPESAGIDNAPPPTFAETEAADAVAASVFTSDTPTLTGNDQPVPPTQPEEETLAELAGIADVAHSTPVAATETAPDYHEVHTTEVDPAHHTMRRIRVVRQVKVNGDVIEETAAEEFIAADADPEPVRARLQEMLRQQSGARMPDPAADA